MLFYNAYLKVNCLSFSLFLKDSSNSVLKTHLNIDCHPDFSLSEQKTLNLFKIERDQNSSPRTRKMLSK